MRIWDQKLDGAFLTYPDQKSIHMDAKPVGPIITGGRPLLHGLNESRGDIPTAIILPCANSHAATRDHRAR